MPTLQQLRYLVALADLLNFSRAAERLNVTQPTLSAQIRELEARLGVPLFERNRARVLLTATGAEIARRARGVLREVDGIRETARAGEAALFGGMLKLGVVHTVGAYLLSVAMPALRKEFPGLRIYVREDRPERLIHQLSDGTHDALVLPEEPERADFETSRLLDERLLVVLPSDHRLAEKPVLDPLDLSGETVLTMEPWHRLHDQIAELCRQTGAELARDYEGTTLDTLRQMVASGMGIALLPALYVRSEVLREKLVVARPLSRDAPMRSIILAWRRTTLQADRFTALARVMRDALDRLPD
ncbi:LysR family transcriptional regulator, hydrogen peroxide-inducible genes activator [Paracoccus aminovorans]|uniref:LysR family transcriptional regulator, hydrogen peroxide-inducible genes activator n=1 Tax=Paracoccus aminovorans TaxID=34004 RepID=A0A1I3EM94_9RHOB|nr:LysR substrate-binding domain-containing protein [Paracoccus aminovorans]CQR84603.1 LysR family transcriptional regulator [Paracoccus aminovorans]SFH99841.1 LysR family transcriptional regulator, hydrogen peroxide-inducible genes activator [Paracoccus aminovorans]